jgi:thiosulfate dehydrogenase [quinone] large subunit
MALYVTPPYGAVQQVSLVLLRTLIGWHFLYEGYFKLALPAWTTSGKPLAPFKAAGYLANASGPFGGFFRSLASSSAAPWIDTIVIASLILVGLSLLLGLFTQLGCFGAAGLLTVFYISAPPLAGTPMPMNEGTYLIVNKNLIELAAVVVLFVFRTGRIAGLDTLRGRWRTTVRQQELVA